MAVDARPSDAIALALRTRAPILVEETVIENAKTVDVGTERLPNDKVQQWLEALDPAELPKYKMLSAGRQSETPNFNSQFPTQEGLEFLLSWELGSRPHR